MVGYTIGYKTAHLLQRDVSSQSQSLRHVLCVLVITLHIKILMHKYNYLDTVPFLTMLTLPSIFPDTYLALIFYLQQVFCFCFFLSLLLPVEVAFLPLDVGQWVYSWLFYFFLNSFISGCFDFVSLVNHTFLCMCSLLRHKCRETDPGIETDEAGRAPPLVTLSPPHCPVLWRKTMLLLSLKDSFS